MNATHCNRPLLLALAARNGQNGRFPQQSFLLKTDVNSLYRLEECDAVNYFTNKLGNGIEGHSTAAEKEQVEISVSTTCVKQATQDLKES